MAGLIVSLLLLASAAPTTARSWRTFAWTTQDAYARETPVADASTVKVRISYASTNGGVCDPGASFTRTGLATSIRLPATTSRSVTTIRRTFEQFYQGPDRVAVGVVALGPCRTQVAIFR